MPGGIGARTNCVRCWFAGVTPALGAYFRDIRSSRCSLRWVAQSGSPCVSHLALSLSSATLSSRRRSGTFGAASSICQAFPSDPAGIQGMARRRVPWGDGTAPRLFHPAASPPRLSSKATESENSLVRVTRCVTGVVQLSSSCHCSVCQAMWLSDGWIITSLDGGARQQCRLLQIKMTLSDKPLPWLKDYSVCFVNATCMVVRDILV